MLLVLVTLFVHILYHPIEVSLSLWLLEARIVHIIAICIDGSRWLLLFRGSLSWLIKIDILDANAVIPRLSESLLSCSWMASCTHTAEEAGVVRDWIEPWLSSFRIFRRDFVSQVVDVHFTCEGKAFSIGRKSPLAHNDYDGDKGADKVQSKDEKKAACWTSWSKMGKIWREWVYYLR